MLCGIIADHVMHKLVSHCSQNLIEYHIRQNVQGGKLLRSFMNFFQLWPCQLAI